jgi:hypothetical protein
MVIEIPGYVPPSLNVWERMHHQIRKRHKTSLAKKLHFLAAVHCAQDYRDIRALVERNPHDYAFAVDVVSHRVKAGEMDWDNVHAGLKPLLDVLQPATEKRKYGLGLIASDRIADLERPTITVYPAKRADERTTITISVLEREENDHGEEDQAAAA